MRNVHDLRPLLVLLASCATLTACAPDVGGNHGTARRDSAGIRIVESHNPVWTGDDGWRIASDPMVRIGTADGPPEQQLFRVRQPRRRSDGSVILLNAGTNEVRIYRLDGVLDRTIGRAGSGPGEFRSPYRLWLGRDDSVYVGDLDRISVFDSAGAFMRSHSFVLGIPDARLSDGTFLRIAYAPGVDGAQLGRSRPDYVLVRVTPDASGADTITRITGAEFYRRSPDGQRIVNYRAPFGAERLLVPQGDRLYTGDGISWEVRILTSDGELAGILRRAGDPEPVTEESIRAFEARLLEPVRTDEQRIGLQQLFREWSYPETQPVYDRLLVDRSDNVWLRHFELPAADSVSWTVLDASGTWLGEVALPGALAIEEIGSDYLLGIRTDDLGVETVELYALMK